jgi:hypothetical protein
MQFGQSGVWAPLQSRSSHFVTFATFCSNLDLTGQYTPQDSINELDLPIGDDCLLVVNGNAVQLDWC